MKCIACHEQMESRTGEIELRINGRLFLVENVTYQQCLSCGERVLNPETSQEIFHKVRSKQYTQKHVLLPVVQSEVAMTG
ncbi:YgiT-type zinc finger protein [Desulfonatronovibrio magnus]|uniref:YgiT-type zinc finger protein n=1 Tax=Desulfonatronovibrio magnus TaxID=698827 RepID=UPI0005EAC858|nr:YgiT-type zinc finger protein [Desulfonatronovibrio magnus]